MMVILKGAGLRRIEVSLLETGMASQDNTHNVPMHVPGFRLWSAYSLERDGLRQAELCPRYTKNGDHVHCYKFHQDILSTYHVV